MKQTKSKVLVVWLIAILSVTAIGILIARPTEAKNDKAFIEEMIPHHEEAVASSKLILTVASEPQVRQIAEAVIAAQEKEISQMNSWFQAWFGASYKTTGVYKQMMSPIDGLSVREAEAQYTSEMINHHEHAIFMAKELLKTTERSELKLLADDIIRSQESEVNELKALLNGKYGQTPEVMDHSSH
ncbi:hypothetical protein C0431_09390 [bacterium]|jgi:uncharacterized protein (DUF305 family)|nr:hypothetical protein [bacterium]